MPEYLARSMGFQTVRQRKEKYVAKSERIDSRFFLKLLFWVMKKLFFLNYSQTLLWWLQV